MTDYDQNVEPSRAALVKRLADGVRASKEHWKKAFKRMRDDMKFAEGDQWPNMKEDDDRVQVDIIQRHINARMSALYAKNPKAIAKRRPKLDFAIWDESAQSLEALIQRLATQPVPMPADAELMRDITEGYQRRKLMDRVGRTLELVYDYSVKEQQPPFKSQAKQLIVRTLTTGVGYTELGFQRALQKKPEVQAGLDDVTSQIAVAERLQAQIGEGEIDSYGPEIERLRVVMADLQAQPEIIVREGLVFSFPCSTRVIPDKKCRNLEGFLGCDRVAVELPLSREDILETYKKDMKGKATTYAERKDGSLLEKTEAVEDCVHAVWRIYDKKDRLVYTVCDGYPDFLEEPRAPDVAVEGFWPLFALVFNKVESERNPFPRSDARLLRSLQKEINRNHEALRQHRIASRPLYVSAPGAFEETEKKNLADHEAHDVVELKNGDRPVDQLIQQVKKAAIDPNLYTPDPIYDAIMRVVGSQEANLGGTSGATATESSIAEASRISSLASNVDDLDDHLTALARAGGQVLLREISMETAQRIAGVGAVWPEFTNIEIAEELFLEIVAGSSGRPNQAQDLANAERAAPFLLQIPGINPEALAKYFVRLLDDRMDPSEFFSPGLPSITAMNRLPAPDAGGDPQNAPSAQGPAGGQNAPNDDTSRGGPQPAFPALAPVS